MYPRLYIAKRLLKDDGVIFISIDDNEVAQLRLLMDEIFGEENFVGIFLWKKNKSGNQNANYMSVQHEYIISFAKNNGEEKWKLPYSQDDLKDYKEKDEKGDFYWKPVKHSTRGKDVDIIFNGEPFLVNKSVYNKNSLLEMLESGEAEILIDSKKQRQLYKKQRLGEGLLPYSFLDPNKFPMTENGVAEVSTLFNNISLFENPKPAKIIQHFIQIGSKPNDLILDFFAGSGTTGDAVMQLNAEDGGNRKFILVQIPEAIDPKKSKVAYDFVKDELKAEPTIFEITKERLIRAANKINSRLDEKTEKLKTELPTEETKEEIKNLERLKTQNNFKIIETTPIWEDYDFEATELDSTQTLFDESKLTEDDIKALLTTWKTYDGVALTEELLVIGLESLVNDETQHSKPSTQNYKAYYGNGKLYLMDKGFTTNNLKTLLEKIDSDKKFSPTSIIAFGYHFESKNLREISENVKSYANKKNIDIDFITRY
jgi:adenine-specific DNA-methyltransferase